MEDRLQKFARLMEIGNFTRAAQELHISQPALSAAIQKLERELGAPLLIRANRRLEPTEAGEAAYQTALAHKSLTDSLLLDIHDLSGRRPRVAIGMIDSIAAALCSTAEPLHQLEHDADVSIVVNNSRHLRDVIEHGTLDVAFVVADDHTRPGVKTQIIGAEKLVLVCHPDARTGTEQQLANGRLDQFIAYNQESASYQLIRQALHSLDVTPHAILHSTSPDVMLRMVLRGRGVAVLPYLLTQALVAQGTLATPLLRTKPITVERPIQLVRLRSKTLPPALLRFVTDAKAILSQH